MQQITKEEAIFICENKLYEDWNDSEIVKFQLFQKRLAMPFGIFHKAMEKVLKRAIYSHEFANSDRLISEYLGKAKAPTFDEILELIQKGKLIVVGDTNNIF